MSDGTSRFSGTGAVDSVVLRGQDRARYGRDGLFGKTVASVPAPVRSTTPVDRAGIVTDLALGLALSERKRGSEPLHAILCHPFALGGLNAVIAFHGISAEFLKDC